MHKMFFSYKKGFTLLETLMVVAILVFLTTLSLPFYLGFFQTNDMKIAEQIVQQQAQRAQHLALSGEADSSWGVRAEGSAVTVFQGTNYTSRVVAADEIRTLPGSITVTSVQEVVFAKYSGAANSTPTIALQQQGSTLSSSLIINSYGTVNIQ